ncbi:MAG: hypothetical protein IPM54_20280 [Polyangiaceae bacterium]|nr:hypothetical protein [Polyangiaceae bacterium]
MSAELHRAIDNHDVDALARLLAAGEDPNELIPVPGHPGLKFKKADWE